MGVAPEFCDSNNPEILRFVQDDAVVCRFKQSRKDFKA